MRLRLERLDLGLDGVQVDIEVGDTAELIRIEISVS